MRIKRGQSILEYVIILTAIVGAVLVGVLIFAKPQDTSQGVGKLMDKAGGTIEKAATEIGSIGNR